MKTNRIFSLLLAAVMILCLFAGCGSKEEPPVPAAEEAPAAEPAATVEEAPEALDQAPEEAPPAPPAADAAVTVAEGDYSIGLIRDGVAQAELTIPSGKVVDIALDYAGKDSTVSFAIDSVSDETVCTAVADILTVTISGAKAGTSVVTASWTAVNTSGSTYTVEITVNVNDDGTESFTELTVGDGAASGEAAQPGASGEASAAPAPIGGSGDPSEEMEPGGILFCGSSLMGGFRIVDTFLAEDGYGDISTGNISMGGTTIADFAAAQKENIVALQPGAIFINIGSVDVDRVASEDFDMQFMQDSSRELLTYLRDNLPDCEIYVMAYYPSQENTFRPNALVETVVQLSQQKANTHIKVDLDLDELDRTQAEAKATYKEIQDYVLKTHDFKVSNLYISQVKRKCGLEMGINYNLPKSDNARVPQCPPEKEAAIMDALRHFQMV